MQIHFGYALDVFSFSNFQLATGTAAPADLFLKLQLLF